MKAIALYLLVDMKKCISDNEIRTKYIKLQ